MSLRNFGRACRQTWRWDEFSERLKQFFTCLQPGALRIMSGLGNRGRGARAMATHDVLSINLPAPTPITQGRWIESGAGAFAKRWGVDFVAA